MQPALDPAGHRVPRTKPTCLLHTWRPHWRRPFALVLHLHQHQSSRNLYLQCLAKNQSTQCCQSLITQGSDHPQVLEPHMILKDNDCNIGKISNQHYERRGATRCSRRCARVATASAAHPRLGERQPARACAPGRGRDDDPTTLARVPGRGWEWWPTPNRTLEHSRPAWWSGFMACDGNGLHGRESLVTTGGEVGQ
jgi:hypothetical protein